LKGNLLFMIRLIDYFNTECEGKRPERVPEWWAKENEYMKKKHQAAEKGWQTYTGKQMNREAIYRKTARILADEGGCICPVLDTLIGCGNRHKMSEFWLFAPRRRRSGCAWWDADDRDVRIIALLLCAEMARI
jgi:hypothetical protein